jgi:hypothetical protein
MEKAKNYENGQALVLLVLSFVVLLGFAALAIDGSRIYSDRRNAQNGADASALAGAGMAGRVIRNMGQDAIKENWNCNLFAAGTGAWTSITDQAIATASTNNFNITTTTTDANRVEVGCYAGVNPHLEITTTLETETTATFAQFVYNGPLTSRVEAVTYVLPPPPVGEGDCIISLTDLCTGDQKGTIIDGGVNVFLNGCGSWSNSCTIFNGSSGSFTADAIDYLNTLTCNPSDCPTLNVGRITQNSDRWEIDIPRPDCEAAFGAEPAHPPKINNPPGDIVLDPGWYDTISKGSGDLTLNPGLYCITKGGFTFNGVNLTGNGVTIVIEGNKGFATAGSATVNLFAPPVGCDVGNPVFSGCPYAVGGLLIWVPSSNLDNVSLNGNSSSNYRGTVYVQEGGGGIVVEGTADTGPNYSCMFIGDTVKVGGDVSLTITYDPGDAYHGPAFMEIAR